MLSTKRERSVLLKLIELIGIEWQENQRAEDIRLDPRKIDALLSVRATAADPDGIISIPILRECCPAFCSVYRQVMLRDVEEFIPNGTANT